ncbi:mitochondrial-processing peptidase subunit beta-like [Sitodiplosis mosellana]|uniref:mitochondrial-processing peptidase subunit beta-like n=1 Tax=Sitodiplosis mosellana TaxID=263140 RepID=UPI0024440FA9|nr:mitochondrial-processing peptidase subunit beta-like [Sitodiplosis mosellana]
MASRLLRLSTPSFRALSLRFKSGTSHSGDYQAALTTSAPTELTSTTNNIRVACQTTTSETTTVGIWLDAGARYEEAQNNGAANFIQRLTFKGTAKRAKANLESEAASLGARLYSFTDREQTAFYATCLNKDVPKIVEILSDAVQNPKLDETDIENERQKILRDSEEIESNVQDVVNDYLHAIAYQGTPLGQTILGPRENVLSLTSKDLKYYIDTHYKASRTVLAASGGVKQNELLQLAELNLGKLDDTFDGEPPVLSRCRYTGSEVRLRDDSLPYAYFALAVEGPGWNSPDRIPLLVATSAIGAYDRSQGKLGENSTYEICHSYQAFNITYSDTGLFGVYSVCEPLQCEHISKAVLEAWHRVSYSITDAELDQAKNRLITKLLAEQSTSKGNCEDIGRSILATGRRTPLNELVATIQNLSNQTVRDITDKYTNNKCPVLSAVGPVENLTDYVNIRTRMYWARV